MAIALICALILDALIGEPRWLWDRVPHPAVLMGRAIGWLDTRFNRGGDRKLRGVLVMISLGLVAISLGLLLSRIPGQIVEVFVAAILLAQRSLSDHIRAVGDGLRLSLGDGRRAVANIVSRDTSHMDDSAVSRSAIESAAENMSDGVIAPAFWFLVAGLPGLLLYKITNTADSMIGYRTPRHAKFGWAAARFDDLLNLIPARLTASMIWILTPRRGAIAPLIADAKLHRSPNAGWPEAAMAPAVGVALAGPRSYDGQMIDFPYVNRDGRHTVTPDDIDSAIQVLWRVWFLGLGLLLLLAIV